jgi:hypothetical protein
MLHLEDGREGASMMSRMEVSARLANVHHQMGERT